MVLSMERWKGKVAIVTGTSAGIGAAIAEELVGYGMQVVGLARRVERVEDLVKKLGGLPGKMYALKADVSKEEDILQAFQWVKDNLGPIHVLVNNAGIVRPTTLIDGNTEHWTEVLNTNVLGLAIATREAVGDMMANNVDGHIIHINSVAGHRVPCYPKLNIYPASKHAVTALTESLRRELNEMKSRIRVTSVSPGGVNTEISKTASAETAKEFDADMKRCPLESEDVADAIIYVLSTPPHVQVHELMIKPLGEKF